jgi:GntR family transcriptional regulator / MocR family aminotransferase
LSRPLSKASAVAFDLPALPPLDGEARQAWVYRLLREAILRGTLMSGMRVPSSRALAARLAVSRSTIEVAFDQLRAEGYVAGVVGSGTFVSAALPDGFLLKPSPSGPAASISTMVPSEADRAVRVDTPFVARVADATLFPFAEWRSHLQAAARTEAAATAGGADALFGDRSLRAHVARYLGAARGIACDASQVLITAGIRQGLNLAGRALLQPTDKVLLEDPGYALAADIFAPYTRRLVSVAIDEAGFSVADARRHAGVRAAHVTPAHQSPTGVTMPVARRLELLNWARERGAWVLEDDYDSEFNYRSAPLPALKSLDEGDRVVHFGSFNKTMFADLRIGYVVVPRDLAAAFAKGCRALGPAVGIIEQRALATFIADGGLARHVRRARAAYARRRERVLQGLREIMAPRALRVTGEHAGFHFVWWLPEDVAADSLAAQARLRGLRLEFVADHSRRLDATAGVLIGDSALDDTQLDDALGRLKSTFEAARARQ